jgi:hypothetical protein
MHSLMLLCYALDKKSHWAGLGFAVSCALASAYGFLQGAWPFGLVEAIWSLVALHRWWHRRRPAPRPPSSTTATVPFNRRSRMSSRS